MMTEINIDALVGPSHHFGGLGVGNLASQQHAHGISHPREAALEGLRKAALVASLGVPQFLFLPPPRPQLASLRELGFTVDSADQLTAALHTAPQAFSAAFSSAFMWAANSATVSAACDTADGRLHFTPANLISSWHRALEAVERRVDLQELFDPLSSLRFREPSTASTGSLLNCVIHAPLSAIVPLRDEGAANHMRLSDVSGQIGFNLFVYGQDTGASKTQTRFLPRQTLAACEAIARRHQLAPERTYYLQQHPQAISAGVFHNDVIATSHEHLLLHHELAFIDAEAELARLEKSFLGLTGGKLQRIQIPIEDLSLEDAVQSYFFNSQIVTPGRPKKLSPPQMVLICPHKCQKIAAAQRLIDRLVASPDNPLEDVHWVSLEQSMANGGGPACLRLRVPMKTEDVEQLPNALRLDTRLEERMAAAIERYYPESLNLQDFCDPAFIETLHSVSARLKRIVLNEASD